MRNKNVAGLLALIFGWIGVHRYYMGQIGLGIVYTIFSWTGIPLIVGIIDAIVLFGMNIDEFDRKYNYHTQNKNTDFDRRLQRKPAYRDHRQPDRQRYRKAAPAQAKANPFKISGIEKYKDYDFEGAISDFKKALGTDSKDIAVHFNLACAYSITEEAEKSLFHLSKAVEFGFVDFDKILEHDALAYLRIQDSFEDFVKNGYQISVKSVKKEIKPEEISPNSDNLLEQIKKLGELREKGFLTDEEFSLQKKKLLG